MRRRVTRTVPGSVHTVIALAAVLGTGGSLAGCHRTRSPEDVLEAYFRHLRRGEVEAAYALTTATYRARRDLVSFAAAVARQPRLDVRARRRLEVVEIVELRPALAAPVVMRSSEGQPLRLATDPLDFYPHDTPEAALASFVRAVQGEHRDRLVDLLGPALRDSVQRLKKTEALPAPFKGAATEVAARLAPASGMPVGVLEEMSGGVRLLLGDMAFVSLINAPDGWLINSVP